MTTHARYSPSGYAGWSACADWESDPTGSAYADEGTLAHEVAAAVLTGGPIPAHDSEMRPYVKVYTDFVRNLGGDLLVEQSLPIEFMTGEAGAVGTADAVIARGEELIVVDLKYGRGVRVDAEGNGQLRMYGAAALEQFDGIIGEFTAVRMVIVQPRLDHISEEVLPVAGLREWALAVMPAEKVVPGEKQCKWCARKAWCSALAEMVQDQVGAEFDEMPAHDFVADAGMAGEELGDKLAAVDLIEDWCRAVRAEAERRLLAGDTVPGFKLVQGRRGARAWASAEEAEATLKAMRLKVEEMYDFKLISPTTAEKLHKAGTIGPRQWARVQALITQPEGKPSVAPESDPRPAINVADDFNVVG